MSDVADSGGGIIHLDAGTLDRLKALAETEGRSLSQILDTALGLMTDLSPAARRALFAMDGMVSADERPWVAKQLGRAVLRAYEGILDSRRIDMGRAPDGDQRTEEAIEDEAVRACRP